MYWKGGDDVDFVRRVQKANESAFSSTLVIES